MTLKVIVAGLGVRGRHWADVVNRSPRADIAAYVDPNPAARQIAASQFGERPSFDSLDEALAALDDVDALVLANPPIGRAAQVSAAAARGLPMLIEKPLALSVADAANLCSLAEAGGVSLMVGLNFRYLGVTLETQRLIRDGVVGTPSFGRFTYELYRDGTRPNLNKYPLTMDQPMLWEQSIHHFDLMRYIYQTEPVSVASQTWNPPWSMYQSDANVAAIFRFENGMVVNYHGLWQSGWAGRCFEWRTDCTDGMITWKEQFGELFYARRTEATLTPVALPPHEIWITETIGLFDAFQRHVLDGTPLECSGRDHLMSLAMVEACALSSREQRSVTIAEVLPQDF